MLNDVVELLRMWYEVFLIMRGKERPEECYVKLALAIDAATRKHRALDGLSITPKVHIVENRWFETF